MKVLDVPQLALVSGGLMEDCAYGGDSGGGSYMDLTAGDLGTVDVDYGSISSLPEG